MVHAAGAVRGGTFRIAQSPPATIEPHLLTDGPGIAIVHQACEMLVEQWPDGVLHPRLATSWTPSQGGKVWTIKLRQGVKFHNGQTMTADDVVATFKRLVDPKSGSSALASFSFLTQGRHQEVDQYTVAFNLSRVVVDFPAYLNTYQAVILPANWPGHFAKHPWGTGAVQDGRVRAGAARHLRQEPQLLDPRAALSRRRGDRLALARTAPCRRSWAAASTWAGTRHRCRCCVQPQHQDADRALGHPLRHLHAHRPGAVQGQAGAPGPGLWPEPAGYHQERAHGLGSCSATTTSSRRTTSCTARSRSARRITPRPRRCSARRVTLRLQRDPGHHLRHRVSRAAGDRRAGDVEAARRQHHHQARARIGLLQHRLAADPAERHRLGQPATPSQFLDTAYITNAVWNASHWSNPTFDGLAKQLDSELDFSKRKAIAKQIEVLMNEEVPSIVTHFTEALRTVRSNVQGVGAAISPGLFLARAWFSA